MTTIETIKQTLLDFQTKKEELTKKLREEFPQLIKPLLDQSEIIEKIRWQQYTPYFNDGDICYFSRGEVLVNDSEWETPEVLRETIWTSGKWYSNPNYNAKEGQILKDIKEVIDSIPDDFYESLFGDHVEVTIYKDGTITTEEFEHE